MTLRRRQTARYFFLKLNEKNPTDFVYFSLLKKTSVIFYISCIIAAYLIYEMQKQNQVLLNMRYFINPQHTFIQQLRFLMNYVIKKLFIFCFLIKLYLFSVQPISAKLFRNLKFIIKKSKANIMYGKCILILLRDFLTLKIKAHKATQPREYTCRIFPFKMNLYSTLQFLCNCCLLYILNLKFLLPPPPEKNIYFKAIQWGQVGEGVMQVK